MPPRPPLPEGAFALRASFAVAFSPDSTLLAALEGGRVGLWEVATGTRSALPSLPNASSIDFSPRGDAVAVKNTSGTVAVIELDPPGERLRLRSAPYGEGSNVRFSADGEYLVDGSWNGDLLVRSATTGEVVLHERGESVSGVDCTADRSLWVVAGGARCSGRRWPWWEHAPVAYEPASALGILGDVALAPDGGHLAAASRGIRLCSVDGGALELLAETPLGGSGSGYSLAWHPSGASLAYTGGKRALVLTQELRVRWTGAFEYPSDVAFSPDGQWLAVGGWSSGAVIPASVFAGDEPLPPLAPPRSPEAELAGELGELRHELAELLQDVAAAARLRPEDVLAADARQPLDDAALEIQLEIAIEAQLGAGNQLGALPPGARAYYATRIIEAEVGNGGFVQAFANEPGLVPAAIEGYVLFGLQEAAELLRRALESGDPQALDDEGESLDNESARLDWARAHPEAFRR